MISKKCYLIDWYADTSAPSKTIKAVITMFNNMKAKWFEPEFISCESAIISNKQTQFITDLREELIKYEIVAPLYLYEPKLNKEQRIKDNLENIMSFKWILSNRNMVYSTFIPKMERQFLEFPNGDHDDVIDTVSQMVEVFRNHWVKKETHLKPQERINPVTWQLMNKSNPRVEYLKKLGIKIN